MSLTAKIIELRNQGFTKRKIANKLQTSMNYVNATMARLIKQGDVKPISQKEAINRQKQSVAERQSKRTDPKIILDLGLKGLSANEIADKLNENVNYVRQITTGLRGKKAEEFRKRVLEVYPTGKPYEEMCKILNCSQGHLGVTVNRLVKKGLLKNRK
jgi:DNA-binding CsgD family transcriptional regulator